MPLVQRAGVRAPRSTLGGTPWHCAGASLGIGSKRRWVTERGMMSSLIPLIVAAITPAAGTSPSTSTSTNGGPPACDNLPVALREKIHNHQELLMMPDVENNATTVRVLARDALSVRENNHHTHHHPNPHPELPCALHRLGAPT